MAIRKSAIRINLALLAVFSTQCLAYEIESSSAYTSALNILQGHSKTVREWDDVDYIECLLYDWDDVVGFYCSIWALYLNDPLVDQWSVTPQGTYEFQGTDVHVIEASVTSNISTTVEGKWRVQGEHYAYLHTYISYCAANGLCTPWIFADDGWKWTPFVGQCGSRRKVESASQRYAAKDRD
ncbi:MAG TPA: hypothetical protein VF193_17025, partial [Steroidobacter sp.]